MIDHQTYKERRDEILDAFRKDCQRTDTNVERGMHLSKTQASQALDDLLLEVLSEDEKQRWDDDDGFCQECDFTRSDDSKECLCIIRNQLRASMRNVVKGSEKVCVGKQCSFYGQPHSNCHVVVRGSHDYEPNL